MKDRPLQGKRILVTGGTGSLGQVLVKRLLSEELGRPEKVIVFSRDEAKQHFMRLNYLHKKVATDEIIYSNSESMLEFRIGDVRDAAGVAGALRNADVVFNAAALKQVPTCEYFPYEAVLTNITGAENIVRAVERFDLPVETVVFVSTDKACKPVNVMGMTKSIQERLFVQANMRCPQTRFVGVRYGNVVSSRGSVVPLFMDQIRTGGPVTVTTPEMTRFLLGLNDAVGMIFDAVSTAIRGETYVLRAPSARVIDIAAALIGRRKIETVITGIRPGEKVHEILISEEESHRTISRGDYYVLLPILPELMLHGGARAKLEKEFSSADCTLNMSRLKPLLRKHMQGQADHEPW